MVHVLQECSVYDIIRNTFVRELANLLGGFSALDDCEEQALF